MKKRLFRKGTLVYRHEGEQYPVYVVMSDMGGKVTLALPWSPARPVLTEVAGSDLERVFSGSSK